MNPVCEEFYNESEAGSPPLAVGPSKLLLLLDMNGVSAQTRTELLQSQFLATRFASSRVVVVPSFFTNQEYGFRFLVLLSTLGHREVLLNCWLRFFLSISTWYARVCVPVLSDHRVSRRAEFRDA